MQNHEKSQTTNFQLPFIQRVHQTRSGKGFGQWWSLKKRTESRWKIENKRRGELTGAKKEIELVEKGKVQRVGRVKTDPPDYIVTQINRPSAGSLESSCNAGEESSHFRGLRSSQQVMGWGAWPSPRNISPHLHQRVGEHKIRATSHLRSPLIMCHFLNLQIV